MKFEDRLHLGNENKLRFILHFARFALSLQHVSLHPIATPAAVAQKHVRLCAHLLQQQSVEARLLLAHARSVCIILPDIEFHLLLQRFEGR